MKKIILLLFILTMILQAQIDNKISNEVQKQIEINSPNEKLLVWIFFTDKGENELNKLSQPNKIVSKKSLKRRAKVLPKNKLISYSDLPPSKNYIKKIEETGFTLRHKSRYFNAVSGYVNETKLTDIANYKFVKKIDIVKKYHKRIQPIEKMKPVKKTHTLNKKNNTHSLDYGESYTQLEQMNVPTLHDSGLSGKGITICLLDAGFSLLEHEVFDSMNIIDKWDFVDNDSTVGGHSHGTGTLSAIGGFKEGELIGPAFGADFLLARTEDVSSETPLEEDNWIAGIEWADSIGADISSTSLGYLDFDNPLYSYTWEDMNGDSCRITIASDLAVKNGIIVVNSAGNKGSNSTHNTLMAPADGDSVITIGAVDSLGNRSSFSSVGNTIDGRIKPDVMAMGSAVYLANTGGTYSRGSGTSFSCPLVAGVTALLLEYDTTLTPMQMRDILRENASNSDSPNRLMGWGIVNASVSLNEIIINQLPENYLLIKNYPNPFNNFTTIEYVIEENTFVRINIYNIFGQKIQTLVNEEKGIGKYKINFNADNLSSGIYFCSMQYDNKIITTKMLLLK